MEIIILALATCLDAAFGEPPNAVHPVAWLGKVISLLERGGRRLPPRMQFLYGAAMTLFTVALCVAPAYFILLYAGQLSQIAGVIVAALLLKITFSLRGLRLAAVTVRKLLESDKLDEARTGLRALVSRNTDLPRPLMVSAAVESVAEGACDSLVAPLFYFLLLGIPGAVAYRAVNTLDAMIGYHGEYEHLGKFAARLDDILNYIPARLTALLLALAALIVRRSGGRAWRTAWREHRRTESPNAGWPIATMAGALGIQLEKPGHYRLGAPGAALVPQTIDDSLKLLLVAASGWILVCFIAGVIQIAVTA